MSAPFTPEQEARLRELIREEVAIAFERREAAVGIGPCKIFTDLVISRCAPPPDAPPTSRKSPRDGA